jgi:selenocysteine lyase/cysteine desulfurase
LGAERKQERLRFLRQRWERSLRGTPRIILRNADHPTQACGIGAVTIDGMPAVKLTEALEKRFRIHVRTRVLPGEFECIRVTPNIYSSLDEVDRFSEAMLQIAHG